MLHLIIDSAIPKASSEIMEANGALKGMFAREIEYLVKSNYKPVNISPAQWEKIKGWFK